MDDDQLTLSNVLSYNIVTNKWTAAGQLVHAVHGTACLVYKDLIFLFGGQNEYRKPEDHVQVYNPALHSCALMPSGMPQAYSLMRAVLWVTSAVLLNSWTCYIYNLETRTWLERKQFKTHMSYFG